MTTKFSQFLVGGLVRVDDIIVGLRGGLNYQFDFPGAGVADAAGHTMFGWAAGAGTPVNYIKVVSGATGVSPYLTSAGTDGSPNFTLTTQGNGNLLLSPGGTGHVAISGTNAVFVPAGTTAERPTGATGGFRYNTTTGYMEYWNGASWVSIISGAALDTLTYITQTDETASAPNSQPLSALATGILYSTTATGVVGSRTLTGTANKIDVTNGTGSAGDPTFTISATYAGQASITTLGTISSGTWNGTVLTGQYGGTGVANTGKTITLGGSLTTSGAFDSTFTMTGATNVTFPTSGTLATTSGATIPAVILGDMLYGSAANVLSALPGNITAVKQFLSQTGTGAVSAAPAWATISGADITGAALTKVDDTNVTLTLGGSPTTALLNASSITAGWTGQLGLTRGGTAASLTADNGGIVYSNATTLAILASTATAGKVLQSGSSTTPAWSTPTYPSASGTAGKILRSDGTNNVYTTSTFADTYTASNLLYSNGANTVTGLATANNGVLVTDGSGVPSISSTLPSGVITNITARLINVQTFTASGTYTKTSGTNTIIVYVIGAGGGSGGNAATAATPTAASAGGGGSGGAAILFNYDASALAPQTVTIGAGGTAGASGGGSAGGTGGTTSFGAICSATGGVGGGGGTEQSVTCSGGVGGTAGVGSGGTLNIKGGPGGYAINSPPTFSATGGNGGDSILGGGGRGAAATAAGIAGGAYGGGGGGSAAQNGGGAQAGAAGSDGLVIVYEFS